MEALLAGGAKVDQAHKVDPTVVRVRMLNAIRYLSASFHVMYCAFLVVSLTLF